MPSDSLACNAALSSFAGRIRSIRARVSLSNSWSRSCTAYRDGSESPCEIARGWRQHSRLAVKVGCRIGELGHHGGCEGVEMQASIQVEESKEEESGNWRQLSIRKMPIDGPGSESTKECFRLKKETSTAGSDFRESVRRVAHAGTCWRATGLYPNRHGIRRSGESGALSVVHLSGSRQLRKGPNTGSNISINTPICTLRPTGTVHHGDLAPKLCIPATT
ncbi:hypothetical protein F4824DRAFT_435271 [Ustulina deusta]|nr:hypothetical protein F4824DRAFT_435271 [Ustulina deusta]